MSTGRRGSRSTSIPDSGANSCGNAKAKNTSPAAPLLPVSVFTQIPIASHITVSPKDESTCPIR